MTREKEMKFIKHNLPGKVSGEDPASDIVRIYDNDLYGETLPRRPRAA